LSYQPAAEPSARWPERLVALARELPSKGEDDRRRVLASIWVLVNEALIVYLWRCGADRDTEPEDIRDIASEKSLELLQRLGNGSWKLGESSPGRVCAFLSTTARNAWIDHVRTRETRRQVPADPSSVSDVVRVFQYAPGAADAVDSAIDRGRFVEAFRGCVASMQPRVRQLWLMRVLLGMSTKDIARHPDVDMRPAAVDVAMGRCRKQMVRCMKSKGFEPGSLPPGTAAALWESFRHMTRGSMADAEQHTGENDEQYP